jgi:hypothetical protein
MDLCVRLQGCGYKAAQREHLATHAVKHSDARPFKCPSCGKVALAPIIQQAGGRGAYLLALLTTTPSSSIQRVSDIMPYDCGHAIAGMLQLSHLVTVWRA